MSWNDPYVPSIVVSFEGTARFIPQNSGHSLLRTNKRRLSGLSFARTPFHGIGCASSPIASRPVVDITRNPKCKVSVASA